MSAIIVNGESLNVGGFFPRPGDPAPAFNLVGSDFQDVPLSQFAGKRKLLQVLHSLDTPQGAQLARQLDDLARSLPHNTIALLISVDTPYAQSRVINTEGLNHLIPLSTLRGRDFNKNYGVMLTGYPLAGLMAPALILIDENDVVIYAELLTHLDHEPNYAEALRLLHK